MSLMSALHLRPLFGLPHWCIPQQSVVALLHPGRAGPHLPAARSLAVACLDAVGAVASSSPPAREEVVDGPAPWRRHWAQLLRRLHSEGHYEADPQVPASALSEDKAAMKRAVLRFARQRADVLAALDSTKLRQLVEAGVPSTEADRKTRNAAARLEASVLRGRDLAPGDGGPADLQDVLRMVLALDAACRIDPGAERGGLAAAAGALLPDILAGMEAPSAGAQLSERAKQMERLKRGARKARPWADRQAAAERQRPAAPWE